MVKLSLFKIVRDLKENDKAQSLVHARVLCFRAQKLRKSEMISRCIERWVKLR